jgi:predicted  nucleic acid-binding Zn-ribbon protein
LKISREKEMIERMNEVDRCLYRIEELEIEIAKAKKELSINAPEIRKEKLRQDAALGEAEAKKARIFSYLASLNSHLSARMDQLENNISKVRGLSFLEPL